MSQVRANTISNVAGTGSPDIVGGELARARTNLNGTGTISPRDDFNISSYVDNGTGDYTANYATAFPNAGYTFLASFGDQTAALAGTLAFFSGSVASTTQFRSQVRRTDSIGTAMDPTHFLLAFFGDRP